ncbi:MAG TPA: hypothetical protein VFI12_09030 [Thermomicrobiales bacterium]|nr:hypothetical protein [Thermomicrobiales bacterium]
MNDGAFSHPINRRQFALGSAAGLAALTFLPARAMLVSAQDAGDLSAMGYPELAVTVTDSSFEGVPDSTAAGRYLLTLTSSLPAGDTSNSGAIGFMSGTSLGMSASDLLQFLASTGGPPPSGTPEAGASPAAGGDGEEGALPLEVYQLHFAGGVFAPPGQTAQAVIDLTPGEYVVWGDDPSLPQKPVTMTVTGDFPTDVKEPTSDITATLVDFAITLEGSLTAGKHIMKVQHHGAQPHFLDIEKGPDTMTKEMVMAAFMGEMSGTPTAGGMSESDMQPVFYSPTQSIGTTTWHMIDLTAGTFLAACFFPTAGTGVPHAMNGMVDVFKVTG